MSVRSHSHLLNCLKSCLRRLRKPFSMAADKLQEILFLCLVFSKSTIIIYKTVWEKLLFLRSHWRPSVDSRLLVCWVRWPYGWRFRQEFLGFFFTICAEKIEYVQWPGNDISFQFSSVVKGFYVEPLKSHWFGWTGKVFNHCCFGLFRDTIVK